MIEQLAPSVNHTFPSDPIREFINGLPENDFRYILATCARVHQQEGLGPLDGLPDQEKTRIRDTALTIYLHEKTYQPPSRPDPQQELEQEEPESGNMWWPGLRRITQGLAAGTFVAGALLGAAAVLDTTHTAHAQGPAPDAHPDTPPTAEIKPVPINCPHYIFLPLITRDFRSLNASVDPSPGETGTMLPEELLDEAYSPDSIPLTDTLPVFPAAPQQDIDMGAIGSPDTSDVLVHGNIIYTVDGDFPENGSDHNLTALNLDGTLAYTATLPYTIEAVGIGRLLLPDGTVYFVVSDDDKRKLSFVDLGPDGLFATADDTLKTEVNLKLVAKDIDPEAVRQYGINRLLIGGGQLKTAYIYTVNGEPDGLCGPVVPQRDTMAYFDTTVFNQTDPEAMGYNELINRAYIGSHNNRRTLAEVQIDTTAGVVTGTATIDISNPGYTGTAGIDVVGDTLYTVYRRKGVGPQNPGNDPDGRLVISQIQRQIQQ